MAEKLMSGPLREAPLIPPAIALNKTQMCSVAGATRLCPTALTLVNKIVWFVINGAKIKMWFCRRRFLHLGKCLLSK